MSATLLEATRSNHEEVEGLERTIVKDIQNNPTCNRDRLYRSHRFGSMIDQVSNTTYKLIEIYEDNDSGKKDEISALGGQMAVETSVFYDRLKEIQEYHRRHTSARVVNATDEYEQMLKEEPQIKFSGEEGFGRYLDLHELYNDYIKA